MRNVRFLFLISFLSFVSSATHADNSRVQWSMDETYDGPLTDTYNKLRWEVPNIIRQLTIDIAVKTGLDFQEGWSSPMTVRFLDAAPPGVESALAYVQYQMHEGKFWQTLNINVQAYENEKFNFNKVLTHELLHAMLNDAVGPEGVSKIPVWFHEGLAVFAADQGEQMVRAYAVQYQNAADDFLLNGLEGAHGALDYAEDYLAFQFIYDTHGQTGFQNFIREVVKRQGDIPGALNYTCSEEWGTFQQNLRKYSLEKIRSYKQERRFRGPTDKPY